MYYKIFVKFINFHSFHKKKIKKYDYLNGIYIEKRRK